MRLSFPRKRTILMLHRRLGILAAVFLAVLALTGLVLNHAEALGLHRIRISNDWVLSRYGMGSGAEIQTWPFRQGGTISYLDGQLYFRSDPLASAGEPVGVVHEPDFSVIALPSELLLVSPSGELIERIPNPVDDRRLDAVGTTHGGEPVLVGAQQAWHPDAEWIKFEPYDGSFERLPLTVIDTPAATRDAILEHYQGSGMTLYRVLLDLHSGRLLGWGGRTVMDMSAVALLLLITSGIGGWLRPSRRSSARH